MTSSDMIDVVLSMRREHFYKSMTSYTDHRVWQDVYHAPSSMGVLYVKFQQDVVTEFVLLSFKEKTMAEAPVCRETGLPMVRAERPLAISYRGLNRTILMPGWYCDASGETIHTREDMKVSDRALVTLKAEVSNLATPDEVRRIRIGLGLSQIEAGRIIGGGPRAFQKYESGEVLASRAMTNLLRALVRHPEDVEQIRADVGQDEGQRESA